MHMDDSVKLIDLLSGAGGAASDTFLSKIAYNSSVVEVARRCSPLRLLRFDVENRGRGTWPPPVLKLYSGWPISYL